MEIWKDITGYEGLYQVSNLGNVKTLPRIYYSGAGYSQKKEIKEMLLKQSIDSYGYKVVGLKLNGKRKMFKVHRLVAYEFLENNNNYKCVNHKNEIKTDNRVENLEWCNVAYNNTYGTRLKRVSISAGKPIIGVNKINGFIIKFNSQAEAIRNGFSDVGASLRKENRYSKGYKFFYV